MSSVIVHPSNPGTLLKNTDILSIYLFDKVTWENGLAILPINLSVRDPIRKEMSQKLIKDSLGEISDFYLMCALSGQGNPPMIIKNPAGVKAFIKKTQGAIGYIDRSDLDDSVKEISILEMDGNR